MGYFPYYQCFACEEMTNEDSIIFLETDEIIK